MIISGKPPRSWNDEDVALFELKLGDLARRFLNLERLQQRAPGTDNAGFDARRITITYPDGNETDKIIWIDSAEREKIDQVAQQVLDYESLKNDDKLLRAVVAVLVEKALGKKEEEEATQLPKIVKERKVV